MKNDVQIRALACDVHFQADTNCPNCRIILKKALADWINKQEATQ